MCTCCTCLLHYGLMSSVKTWSSLQELIGLEHGNEDFILPPYVLPHLCISAALSENARVWLALAQLFYDPLVHHYQDDAAKSLVLANTTKTTFSRVCFCLRRRVHFDQFAACPIDDVPTGCRRVRKPNWRFRLTTLALSLTFSPKRKVRTKRFRRED